MIRKPEFVFARKSQLLLSCDQIATHLSSSTKLIGPAAQMAEWILENWKFKQSGGPDRWFTTGDTTKLVGNGRRAFGVIIKKP